MDEIEPIVHNWYLEVDRDEKFSVVAVDEINGLIEIQQLDGNIEEMTLETWNAMNLESIEVPEDWTGPIDDFTDDDMSYTETAMMEREWNGSSDEEDDERIAARLYHWEEDFDELRQW